MRNIQNLHMNTNRWADIGYNFCVGGDGLVYEGRGWTRVGAHALNFNSVSIGICFIGTFTGSLPTLAARNAAQALIRCGVSGNHIRSDHRLGGHRQFSVC
jgi:N-acetylmuramoyl-L-alanine amidase